MPAEPDLADAYETAWTEWDCSGEAGLWDELAADELGASEEVDASGEQDSSS